MKKKNNDVGPITFIGPVQFRTGRSLHKVDLSFIKGTGAFASNETSSQKTFREEYVLPYSLITFYGVVNENAAKDTELSEDDLQLLFEGIWYGTKNLISRSKFGQMPRFLLQIEYNEKDFFIGDLNHKISLDDIENEKSLRDISECPLNVEKLLNLIYKNRDKISKICFKVDDGVVFNKSDDKISFKKLLENKFSGYNLNDINSNEYSFDWDYCLSIEKKEE